MLKTMCGVLLAFVMMACGLNSLSGTHGDGVGNGDGVVTVDGVTYKLADLFFVELPGQRYTLDKTLENQMWKIFDAVNLYELKDGVFEKFFRSFVFDPLVVYRFVPMLPNNCKDEYDTSHAPAIPVACTSGSITWIVPKYFEKLSIEERAGLILHERLHAYAPNQPHEVIVPFVRGILVLQRLLAVQGQYNLTSEEMLALELMLFAGKQLSFISELQDKWALHQNGGGQYGNNAVVDKFAYLDVSSKMSAGSAAAGAIVRASKLVNSSIGAIQITNSDLKNFKHSGPVAGEIKDSVMYCETVEAGSNVHLEGAIIRSGADCFIKDNAFLKAVALYSDREITIGEFAQLDDVVITHASQPIEIGKASRLERSSLRPVGMAIAPQSQILDSKVSCNGLTGLVNIVNSTVGDQSERNDGLESPELKDVTIQNSTFSFKNVSSLDIATFQNLDILNSCLVFADGIRGKSSDLKIHHCKINIDYGVIWGFSTEFRMQNDCSYTIASGDARYSFPNFTISNEYDAPPRSSTNRLVDGSGRGELSDGPCQN